MEPIDNEIRAKKLQLGQYLKNIKKLYLDLNYWVRMRECYSDSHTQSDYFKLYNLISTLVKQEKIICPISQRIFIELHRQEDRQSLILTAKTIDKLSCGVTILSEPEREQSELWYYVHKRILGNDYITAVDAFIWAKIPYVFGIMIPFNEKVSPEIQNEIQFRFLEYSWEITLEEMIQKSEGRPIPRELLSSVKSAMAMNIGKNLVKDKIKSIKQVFHDELIGVLDIYKDLVVDFYKHLRKTENSILNDIVYKGYKEPDNIIKLVYEDIKGDRLGNFLPSLYCQVCFHSLIRWDKRRDYKPNDLDDFHHATTALPYYDYFLTEKPLAQLVESGPYRLGKKYNTSTFYNPIEAFNHLSQLS